MPVQSKNFISGWNFDLEVFEIQPTEQGPKVWTTCIKKWHVTRNLANILILGGFIFQYIPPLGSVLFQGCFPYACASFKTWNSSLYFQQTAESQSCIQLCKLHRSHHIQNIIRYLLAKIDICLEGKRMKLFSG